MEFIDEDFDRKLRLQIEGMRAVARKIEPFLPKLNPAILHQYSSSERPLLNSLLFRALRFASIPGNEVVFSRCLKALPSSFMLPDKVSCKEPYIFIPVVGELLNHLWHLDDSALITETLGTALGQLGILSDHDRSFFDSRLILDFSGSTAVYMQHPFKTQFSIKPDHQDDLPYNYQLSKVEF